MGRESFPDEIEAAPHCVADEGDSRPVPAPAEPRHPGDPAQLAAIIRQWQAPWLDADDSWLGRLPAALRDAGSPLTRRIAAGHWCRMLGFPVSPVRPGSGFGWQALMQPTASFLHTARLVGAVLLLAARRRDSLRITQRLAAGGSWDIAELRWALQRGSLGLATAPAWAASDNPEDVGCRMLHDTLGATTPALWARLRVRFALNRLEAIDAQPTPHAAAAAASSVPLAATSSGAVDRLWRDAAARIALKEFAC